MTDAEGICNCTFTSLTICYLSSSSSSSFINDNNPTFVAVADSAIMGISGRIARNEDNSR